MYGQLCKRTTQTSFIANMPQKTATSARLPLVDNFTPIYYSLASYSFPIWLSHHLSNLFHDQSPPQLHPPHRQFFPAPAPDFASETLSAILSWNQNVRAADEAE